METKIKVAEVHTVASKVLFEISLLSGYYTIGDNYRSVDGQLGFTLIGVGMDNSLFDKNSISIAVKIEPEYSLEQFKDVIFIKSDD